jgi:hypothetical protein
VFLGPFFFTMKESFYFSHDSNARNDVKILKLRRNLGFEGYGLYWCLIEMLREAPEYKLSINCIDDIAYSFNIDQKIIKSIINDFDLFLTEDDLFYSERLVRSMEQYKLLKEKKSMSGKEGMRKRWDKNNKQNKMIL